MVSRALTWLLGGLCINVSVWQEGQTQTLGNNNPVCVVQTAAPVANKFKLLITLYNEKKEKRRGEYIQCIENNLKNKFIDAIRVVYDTSGDNEKEASALLDYLKSKNLKISYVSGRASFGDMFQIANGEYLNSKIIISNADIYFDETLGLLEPYDLRGKFLVLSRWEVCNDGTLSEHSFSGGSQDTWMFQTPLPKFENSDIKIGILGCENAIAYQAQQSGLKLFNPSYSIKCQHLHKSRVRHYKKKYPYKSMNAVGSIHKCTVIEMDEPKKTLVYDNLRLSSGRWTPIVLN